MWIFLDRYAWNLDRVRAMELDREKGELTIHWDRDGDPLQTSGLISTTRVMSEHVAIAFWEAMKKHAIVVDIPDGGADEPVGSG